MRPGKVHPRFRIAGIDRERLLQDLHGFGIALPGRAQGLLDGEQGEFIGSQAVRMLALGGGQNLALHRTGEDLELADDLLGDVRLDGEQIGGRAIPAIGPDLGPCRGIAQPSGGAELVSLTLDRAFQDEAHGQVAPDLPHIGGSPPVGFGRGAGDHIVAVLAGEIGDDVVGQTVGQTVRRLVRDRGRERQDRDGRAQRGGWLIGSPPEPEARAEAKEQQGSDGERRRPLSGACAGQRRLVRQSSRTR